MKITPNNRISKGKVTSKKTTTCDAFGSIFASEQARNQPIASPQQHTQPEQEPPQTATPLDALEQASDVLQRALSQLEQEASPSPESLQAIQTMHHELDTLLANDAHSRPLMQAKTMLNVEAQRIKHLK